MISLWARGIYYSVAIMFYYPFTSRISAVSLNASIMLWSPASLASPLSPAQPLLSSWMWSVPPSYPWRHRGCMAMIWTYPYNPSLAWTTRARTSTASRSLLRLWFRLSPVDLGRMEKGPRRWNHANVHFMRTAAFHSRSQFIQLTLHIRSNCLT